MKARNVVLLALWMSGVLLSFSGVALAVRSLTRTLSVFEVLALRNEAGLVFLLIAAGLHPAWRSQFRPLRPNLHVLRNTVHFGSQYGWSYSVAALPLATAFALEFTAPIWLALLAVIVLGERMTLTRLAAIVLGLIGVLVILRPGHEAFQPAALVMLASAFGFGATAAASKLLTKSVPTFTILLWMNIIQLLLNLFTADWLFWSRIDAAQIPGVIMLTVGGLASHLCQLQAYRYGDAIVVMPLDFLRIPLIAVIGWSFYREPLDGFVFLGAGLIVTGIVWNLWAEARRPAPQAQPELERPA